ncbi:DivIVA domain-containing protein [Gulosibacter sp. GYB002]|uniref:DivIVA domain-containing protein n=1 Tax=Gulosibacter sp. GYB002 TaxID=2994391 RepID=UPI002F969A8E
MRSEDVINEQFRATKYVFGYDQFEVDNFLDRAAEALYRYETGEASAHSLTASQVEDVKFESTRFKAGYDLREVDEFLDRLAAAFAQYERDHANQ